MITYLVKITNPKRPDIPPRYKPGVNKAGTEHKVVETRFRGEWKDDFKDLDVELLAFYKFNHDSASVAYKHCEEKEQLVLDTLGRKDPGRPPEGYEGEIDNVEEYFDIDPIKGSGGFTELLHKKNTDENYIINKFCELTGGERYYQKDYVPVGSIVQWKEDYLQSASKRGKITKGTKFKVVKFDFEDFHLQALDRRRYDRKWSRANLLQYAEIVNE